MWERLERSLSARGIDPQMYVQMQGKPREELVTDMEGEAERALKREATLAAVADAEGIEVDRRGAARCARSGAGRRGPREAPRPPAGDRPRLPPALRGPAAQGRGRDRGFGEAHPGGAGRGAGASYGRRRRTEPEAEAAESGLWTPGSD